jgi:CBS domain-containing protein
MLRAVNVAFFLVPKSTVVWVAASGTLAQAVERMRPNGYMAIPVLDDDGGYVGTLTEGDILWHLLDAGTFSAKVIRDTPLSAVVWRVYNEPVHIDANIEDLIERAAHQNFVPVVDDRGVFIGIVPRRPIIEHCAKIAGLLPQLPFSARVRKHDAAPV